MELAHFAALAVTSFLGASVQAATGFGFAILTVPFFLLIMGSTAAIQVAAVTNLAISVMLAPRLFRDAPRPLMLALIAGSIAGFPAGLALFRAADLATMKLLVGGVITAFALLLAWRELRAGAAGDGGEEGRENPRGFASMPALEFGAGAASGMMAAALAMPGPAVMLYLAARRPGKRISRAATLTLFGFSYAAVSILHTLWGGMGAGTWLLALGLVPFVLAGAFAGNRAALYLSEGRFRAAVLIILLASGLYAVWNAL